MPPLPLTDAQLADAVGELPDWEVEDAQLVSEFRFPRSSAPHFLVAVAAAEDAANHHALITVLYDTVSFSLRTHDAGDAVTTLDVALARQLSVLAARHGASQNRATGPRDVPG